MDKDLSKKLRNLRKRANISQEELAEILGVSRVHICNIENGRRGLSLEQINTLCKHFKISANYFFEEEMSNECEFLVKNVEKIFKSEQLTQNEKDNLFGRIMEIYLDSKKDN